MKPINTSTFDFPTLIREEFVYVDKTRQIYELARRGTDHIYFFPRPRRFGKSLLLSTLKALFQGRRELFKGLAIDEIRAWDWKREVYPVLHLDMSDAACSTAEDLNTKLNLVMKSRCAEFGVEYDAALPASGNFLNLLNALPKVAKRGKYKKGKTDPNAANPPSRRSGDAASATTRRPSSAIRDPSTTSASTTIPSTAFARRTTSVASGPDRPSRRQWRKTEGGWPKALRKAVPMWLVQQ